MAFSKGSVGALICFISLTLCSGAPPGQFRGSKGSSRGTMAAETIKADLREIMDVKLKGGDGAAARRLAAIEASLWQTFLALPKNKMGHLAPRAVRHIVHNFFAKRHGWVINGLEAHGMQESMTEVHDVTIFQDKAPALVEGLLEARHADHGMSLNDVVVMVAVLERLIFDESIALLEKTYHVNSLSAADELSEERLHEVLTSYMISFETGIRIDNSDPNMHHAAKEAAIANAGSWQGVVDFEQDAVSNFNFARRHATNPFAVQPYSFEDATLIVEDMADGYGRWQNSECSGMKEDLMRLAPDGSGLIPLSRFYTHPETSDYQFTESVDYLRRVGALDESSSWGEPRVRLANYVAGPSNCIAASTYFSVCCLSECEGLLNELEEKIKAPSASPERLLDIVANLSSASVEAPRVLPETLKERLSVIAERSESGEVPLHGRLFAQWLHYAFPNECAYPHIAEDATVLSPTHWKTDGVYIADAEDRARHVAEVEASASAGADEATTIEQWSDDEVLPLLEPQSRPRSSGGLVRSVAQLAMLSVVLRIVYSKFSSVATACGFARKGKGEDGDFVLPKYA